MRHTRVVLTLAMGLALCSCKALYLERGKSTPTRQELQRQRWSKSHIAQIKLGMSEAEFVERFGMPDERSIRTMGTATSQPWQGLVLGYKFRDPAYRALDVYKHNTFVFSMSGTSAILNHYDVEVMYDDPSGSAPLASAPADNHPPSDSEAVVDRHIVIAAGTGFCVSADGLIVTAQHVIADASDVVVKFANGEVRDAVVVRADPSNDIAVLRTDLSTPHFLHWASSRSVAIGSTVFTIGYPAVEILGDEPKYTDGVVSALSGIGGTQNAFQITVPIQPGSSGGPLINEHGCAIGVITSTARASQFEEETGALPQGINWALKGDYAALLLDAPEPCVPATDRGAMIENARQATVRVLCRRQ